MKISVITIFPEFFKAYLTQSIVGKAIEKSIAEVDVINLRDFTEDTHMTVDDSPYGGGPGMVMKPEPIERAIKNIKYKSPDVHVIFLSPQGRPFNQHEAKRFSSLQKRIVFICGRYEGIDERAIRLYADDEISIGDYILTGGELPALVIIDTIVRLLPGALGHKESLDEESFSWGILDYPHFTRPADWNGIRVPDVLLSGNHEQIRRHRRKEAIRGTMRRRPDLLSNIELTEEDEKLILEIKEEEDGFDKGC